MSVVTTITIISDGYGDEEKANLKVLNDWITERYSERVIFRKIEGSEYSAGTKYPQRNLYWGGFNYLNKSEFIDVFRSIDWEYSVMIIGYEDSERGYTVVPSRGKGYGPELGDTPIEVVTKC